jgi:hypothetical protein
MGTPSNLDSGVNNPFKKVAAAASRLTRTGIVASSVTLGVAATIHPQLVKVRQELTRQKMVHPESPEPMQKSDAYAKVLLDESGERPATAMVGASLGLLLSELLKSNPRKPGPRSTSGPAGPER